MFRKCRQASDGNNAVLFFLIGQGVLLCVAESTRHVAAGREWLVGGDCDDPLVAPDHPRPPREVLAMPAEGSPSPMRS
jgi:hypothetical protein